MSDETMPQPQKSEPPKPPSGNKTLIIVVAAIVGVGLLGGVGYFLTQQVSEKSAEKAIEQATGGKANVDISESGDKVTIKTEEGTATFGKNEVPGSFPDDITIYSGSEVASTTETADGVTVLLKTSDSTSKVNSFYKEDLVKNGWKIVTSVSNAGTNLLTVEKGNKSAIVTIAVDEQDNKTTIYILIADKP